MTHIHELKTILISDHYHCSVIFGAQKKPARVNFQVDTKEEAKPETQHCATASLFSRLKFINQNKKSAESSEEQKTVTREGKKINKLI